MPGAWNGDLEIVLYRGWYTAGIPGAFTVHCDADMLNDGLALFAGILSAPDKEGQPAAFALQRITMQRIAPDRMTSAMRWRYVEDKAFDPKAFLGELDQDLSGAGDVKKEAPIAK